MNRKKIIYNYLLLDNQGLILLKPKKTIKNEFKRNYFTYEKLKDPELKGSLYKLRKGQTALLIPASQLFIESFFISKEGKSKLDEIIRVKFINQLPLSENEIYYSYYLGQENLRGDYLVICFAFKREIIDNVYEMLVGEKVKIKYILPLPVLLYIYHYNQNRDKIKKEICHEKSAIIYLDRYYNKLAFTVFHSDGLYLRSANLENMKSEVNRTVDYLKEYFGVENLEIYSFDEELNIANIAVSGGVGGLEESFQYLYQGLKKADIKSLNLLSQLSVKKRKKLNRYQVTIGLLVILILICNILTFDIYIREKNNSLIFNQKQLQELEPTMLKLEELEEEITIGEKKRKIFRGILENKQSYLHCLYELSKELPEGTKISHLSIEGDKMILLDGHAPSAAKVMEALQDSSIFNNLEFIGGIAIDQDGERFRIAGDLIND